jgi:hypothetical protein
MKFKEIRIRLMEYGEFNGQIVATLSIEGKAADMQITIPEPHSLRILQACGEIVAEAGQEQAAKFREEFMAAISPQNTRSSRKD